MTGEDQTTRVEEITATMTAVCTLLMRRCLDATKPADADAARSLSRHLVQIGAPKEIMAMATVGVWAAFGRDGQLDDDVLASVAAVAQVLIGANEHDGLELLAALTLMLLARRGCTDDPTHDLVLAAQTFWSYEHHDLAVLACRESLVVGITPLDEATALMLLARITGDADDVGRLRAASRTWSDEVKAKVDVRNLVLPAEGRDDRLWDRARDAAVRGDRSEAARLMAETTTHLAEQSTRDRDFLDGLRRGFLAMSGPTVDVEGLRRGLIGVVRQVRARQRFGNIPPTARSGLELLILILLSDDNEAKGSVLAELMEALADAGLSEVVLSMDDRLPYVAEADLAEKARHFPLWPDLRACVDGLGGNFGLLARRIGGGRSSAERWLTMFVSPPDGVLIRSAPLVAEHAAVLDRLTPSTGPVTNLTQPELDEVVHAFLHRKAVDMLAAEPARGLVVIPDGPLWRVPWQAASLLRSRPITVAPSMTLYSALGQPPGTIHSIVALIGAGIADAELVEQALDSARDHGGIDVAFGLSALDRECDLLLVLAHGTGDGLSFQIGVGDGLTAHELARRARARTALVACCGSAKTPPVALPVNLPVSLLMRGCTHCVGGMWLLPQKPTARLVAATIAHLGAGRTLAEALSVARGSSMNLLDDWGMASVGSIGPWTSSP